MIEINVKIDKQGQEWNAESGNFKKAGKTKLDAISSLFSEIQRKKGYILEKWIFTDDTKNNIIAFFKRESSEGTRQQSVSLLPLLERGKPV